MDISNCFGFKLKFVSNPEYGINDYECNFIHKVLYDLVLNLSGRLPGQEAYDNYEISLFYFRENAYPVDKESPVWKLKSGEELIKVPREEREKLIEGIGAFLDLLDNIESQI